MFTVVDSILKRMFLGIWPGARKVEDVARMQRLVNLHMRPRKFVEFVEYANIFNAIDGKMGNVITHLSVMIAVTAALTEHFQAENVSLQFTNFGIEFAILSQILIFLMLVTVSIALRATRFWTFDESYALKHNLQGSKWEDFEYELDTELAFRVKIHRICLNTATLLSGISLLLFIVSNWI